MRYAIISDLHLGNNKNNPVFHNISINYAHWLKGVLKENKIENIIIAGDVFHERTSINLATLNAAYEFFDILSEFQLHIIAGNHDCFYLNNSTVHSLSLLKRWPNITIYDEPTLVDDIAFIPWGTVVEDMPEAKINIGHYEVVGFDMSKYKVCSHGIKGADLMEKSQIVFTGHFHKPQIRMYNKRPLYYTGSCFQLNWGESGEDKFVYLLDSETLNVEKIQNTVSPTFQYIESEDDYSKIPGNFISVKITDSDKIDSILDAYSAHKPLDIKTQYAEVKKTTLEVKEIEDFEILDIKEVFSEMISELVQFEPHEQKEILEDATKLYKEFEFLA